MPVLETRIRELELTLDDVPHGGIRRGGDRLKAGNLIDVKLSELIEAYEQDLFGKDVS